MTFLPKSLFGRFVLIIAIPILVIQLVTAYIFYQRHWESVTQYMKDAVVSELVLLAKMIEGAKNMQEVEAIIQPWQVIFDVRIEKDADTSKKTKKIYATRYQFAKIKSDLEKILQRSVYLYYLPSQGKIGCDIQFTAFTAHIEFSVRRIYSTTVYVFIIWVIGTSILLCVIALFFMKNQVRSITNLTDAANRFGSGRELDQNSNKFIPSGPNEIRLAGFAFIKMKKRIERSIKYRNELLTHISHDLRTPITRMKLRLAMQPDNDLNYMLNANLDKVEEMLSKYLQFAKEEGNEQHQHIDIVQLIANQIRIFDDKRIIFVRPQSSIMMNLQINALNRLINNLLSNAAKFAQHFISISIHNSVEMVTLIIEDDGPGIPPDLYKQALYPFSKLNTKHDGFGLGLSIVNSIAQAHGGRVKLGQSSEYGGLSVAVMLQNQ